MRKTRIVSFSLAACVLLGLSAGASPSAAADECDGPILDRAAVLDDAGRSRIEAAVSELYHQGADVHIFTTDDGDLEEATRTTVAACPAWQQPGGAPKSNLLVFALNTRFRDGGIFYGSGWEKALGNGWYRVIAKTMGPAVRERDIASAFVTAAQQASWRIQAVSSDGDRTTVSSDGDGTIVSALAPSFLGLFAAALAVGFFLNMRRRDADAKSRISALEKQVSDRVPGSSTFAPRHAHPSQSSPQSQAEGDVLFYRTNAADRTERLRKKFDELEGRGLSREKDAKARFYRLMRDYAKLLDSSDPVQLSQLSAEECSRIASRFRAYTAAAARLEVDMEGIAAGGRDVPTYRSPRNKNGPVSYSSSESDRDWKQTEAAAAFDREPQGIAADRHDIPSYRCPHSGNGSVPHSLPEANRDLERAELRRDSDSDEVLTGSIASEILSSSNDPASSNATADAADTGTNYGSDSTPSCESPSPSSDLSGGTVDL